MLVATLIVHRPPAEADKLLDISEVKSTRCRVNKTRKMTLFYVYSLIFIIDHNMARYRWRSYQDAKKYVHKLKFSGKSQYANWAKTEKRPKDIPAAPRNAYLRLGSWMTWGDYLGTSAWPLHRLTRQ